MASTAANGSPKDLNGSQSKIAPPNAQQTKAAFPPKMSDSKKSDEEPSQRRTPQPRAWTSGVNPITQRSNTPQANGAGPRPSNKPYLQNALYSQNASSLEKNNVERQMLVMHNSIGSQCSIVTRAGEAFTGMMTGAQRSSDDYNVVFKMVSTVPRKIETIQNGIISGQLVGAGSEHTIVFPLSSLARIDVPEKCNSRPGLVNGTSGSFRTDADISGNQAARERNLQRWEAPSTNNVDMSLESSTGGEWDQFKANEQMFGVKSDYDENIYTTRIDRNSPQYASKEREAERIAREIEGDVSSSNPHIREERGQKIEGLDEEAKYSGVTRNTPNFQPLATNQPGRYMPPGRRQQTTVSPNDSSVVDPAIISSQIARPDSIKPKPEPRGETSDLKPEQRTESRMESKVDAPKLEPKTQPAIATTKETKVPKQLGKPGVTENVENEVLDSFRQFLATEKLKVQDTKRSRASHDKAVKLNDLKKFSKNFKLVTPVPKDLVPILAKDEGKQRQIVEKAQRIADASKAGDRPTIGLIDPKSQRPLAVARWEGEGGQLPGDDSKLPKGAGVATVHAQKGQLPNTSQRAPSGLSARLQEGHRMHKAGLAAAAATVPAPLPIRDNPNAAGRTSGIPNAMISPQKSASLRGGPPSATSAKFNAAAREFRPNPAASTFKPGVSAIGSTPVASSPTRSGSVTRSISPAGNPPKFFGDKKSFGKWSERPDPINTVKPRKNEDGSINFSSDNKGAASFPAQNGGWPFPYRTFPTWVAPPEAENGESEMKYYEAFDKFRTPKPVASPTEAPHANASAHQHQLPFHLQNGSHPIPQVHTPQQAHHPIHHQQQHFTPTPHYDEHHMRPSASNSSHYPAPSPRMHNTNMAYQSPMPPPAQLYGQPVQYVMQAHPSMGGRQFPNGHQMVSAPGVHLTPVMAAQHSSGGYVPQPMPGHYAQVPVYPGPNSQMYPAPVQPPSGYPSPSRHAAPMMVHQGSHQGYGQPVYVPAGQFVQPMHSPQPPGHMPAIRGGFGSPQPHFAQGPYQQHQLPHQARRTPSTGYVQPHQLHHHMPSQHGPPQVSGTIDLSDEAK